MELKISVIKLIPKHLEKCLHREIEKKDPESKVNYKYIIKNKITKNAIRPLIYFNTQRCLIS